MGPRPLGRGIGETGINSASTPCFNGATISRSWNPVARAVRGAGDVASMGPRPLGRGIHQTRAGVCVESTSFNGATTSRSWNPGDCRERRRTWSCRFNGATTSRSWNLLEHPLARWDALASMGPRPLGRGIESLCCGSASGRASFNGATTSRSWNLCAALGAWRSKSGFNGATTSRSWNRPFCSRKRRTNDTLQWGHDLSVVESGRGLGAAGLGHHASMGPRPLGRGIHGAIPTVKVVSGRFNGATTSRSWNPYSRRRVARKGSSLQWGHDLSVVESFRASCALSARACFNGATTSRSWNPGKGPTTVRRRPVRLQWGHDLSVVESCAAAVASRPTSGRFNGATTSRSWNPHHGGAVPAPPAASMGPRPLGRGISAPPVGAGCSSAASMGPRPLGRGILPPHFEHGPMDQLQWGHDLSVVESVCGLTSSRPVSRLQWGHDLSVVESRIG